MRLLPVLFALLLAGAAGCNVPSAPLPAWGAREGAAAAGILQRDYGLAPPPPCALDVFWPAIKGPGHFTLEVRGSGWRLEAPLERLALETRDGPGATVFTWDAPLAPVLGDDARMYARPMLLHLSRGGEHRALVVPCRATRLRGPVREAGAGFPTLFLDPVIGASAAPVDGAAGIARFTLGLERDGQGGGALLIGFEEPAGTLRPPATLEEIRGAFGCFQPELAAGITRDPAARAAFRVPLEPGALERGRSLLVLLRSEVPGEQSYALWAVHYPPGGAWARAFRLLRGPWNPGPP